MTLETCKKRLELAKEAGNNELVKVWEEKIESRLRLPKYAHLREKPKEVKKSGKAKKR